ncbi:MULTISPECIES: hypothetical protein [unclassified Imperialibacter]|uniref:hypothetical protein n=1 Tax=unclassified Imperialibacter TaxID=2629706 RepID=UPI001254824C|nr:MULTISPECIES: hypothetical protein [unclassified Imperialibacter]CAD5283814.1 conserved hypothetical protein [Imperialibacter sp. 89]CAD5285742.1 conserved hypothetical protein [Imperialibacter sp. 75]VVT29523.1 conserved hypothetical protein [Imperialibacter sp. EC-SDR9]
MDFFNPDCQELPINHSLFGICDDQEGGKAYTDLDNPDKWIATVRNDKNILLTFAAIDKCVVKDDELKGVGRCDGMLTSNTHLYLIELKDQVKKWIPGALEQLESTIKLFIANHDISAFRHKKAFACNKRHRHFEEIDNELNLHFFRTYGFRIDVQVEVIIV